VEAYIDGYVGPKAQVSTQYMASRIMAPVPPDRVCISMIAENSCAEDDSNLEALVAYAQKVELLGIMQWAVGTYGCHGTQPGNKQWQIGDWDCKYTPACPGLLKGKAKFLGAAV
jgi:hypothetical protein